MSRVRVREELRLEFWRGNLKEIVHLEDLCINLKVLLKYIFKTGCKLGSDSSDSR
jgi:hypothetical protein